MSLGGQSTRMCWGWHRELIALRHSETALRHGEITVEPSEEAQWLMMRREQLPGIQCAREAKLAVLKDAGITLKSSEEAWFGDGELYPASDSAAVLRELK